MMTFEQAKIHLGQNIQDDGRIESPNELWSVGWEVGQDFGILDGQFSLDDMEAIVVYMREMNRTNPPMPLT